MAAILQTRALRKSYGSVQALQGVDIELVAGEVFGFLGPNGAGKTTFTKCVTGFVRPDSGSVHVMGIDARANPVAAAHHIGLVPDQYDFYSNLTGRQHLDFYGRLLGMPSEPRRARVQEVLALVRMEERADTRVKGYSHGMKQRICIAQAILHKPALLLFDEPTNGLDPQGAYELRLMLRDLARSGASVFLNSHLMSEVQETCHRVAILDKGRVVRLGSVESLRRTAGAGVAIRLLNPLKKHLTAVQAVTGVAPSLDGQIIRLAADEATVAAVVTALAGAGAKVASVIPETTSLEDVFLEAVEAK